MDTVRTIACNLMPPLAQRAERDATLVAFAEACTCIADSARPAHTTNKVKVQPPCDTDVRTRFGVSATLARRAMARVCAAIQVKSKTHATLEPPSIDDDQRLFSFWEGDWTFSLTLLPHRARLDAALGDYQQGRRKGHPPPRATRVKRPDGTGFLPVPVQSPAPPPRETADVLGVDLGRTASAHTSDEQHWSGQPLTRPPGSVEPPACGTPDERLARPQKWSAEMPGACGTAVGACETVAAPAQPCEQHDPDGHGPTLRSCHRPGRVDRHAGAHQPAAQEANGAPP